MYSVKNGNRFQLAAISYFILGNLVFGFVIAMVGGEVGIVPSILVSQVVFVGGAILFYTLRVKAKPVDFFIKPIQLLDGLICVGIAWTIMPLLSAINVLSQFFVTNQIQDALLAMTELPYLVTLLLTCLFPALFEELLSRAVILRNYQRQTVLITCMVSGAFFGFIHLNINQFLYAFVMGIIMCYVVMITDSILSAMIIHFTINATGTTTLYVSMWFLNLFDDSGALMEEFMTTASPSNAELLISFASVLFMALFFTPIAGILINQLLKRHGKVFRGSHRMITSEFMRRQIDVAEEPFSDTLSDQTEDNTYVADSPMEKVVTIPFVLTGFSFLVFAVLLEFLM